MKLLIFFFLFTVSIAYARLESGPREYYDVTHLMIDKSIITIHTVEGPITRACNKERKLRGQPVFTYAVEACSFWNGAVCDIYLGGKTNNDIIGHEVHHCFAGNFHK